MFLGERDLTGKLLISDIGILRYITYRLIN